MKPVRLEPATPRSPEKHSTTELTHKIVVIMTVIHKMLVRMANREDPDQTASSEAV